MMRPPFALPRKQDQTMTSRLLRWALVLGLALSAAPVHGQDTEEGAPEPADAESKRKLLPFPGLRYGAPLGFSLYGGVMLGRQHPAGYSGPTLIGEVGQDGGRVSLGWSSVGFGTGRAQLSYIRTWDDHGGVWADQSYVGPEIAVGFIAGVTAGYYWRISDGGGKARMLAIGSFIGF
jgi:hypothetical protein